MPWLIKQDDKGRHCVYKQGAGGEPTGESLGCHGTEQEAKDQMAALYANEPGSKAIDDEALKFNPHHDADGKFTSGGGGGAAGGGASVEAAEGKTLSREQIGGFTKKVGENDVIEVGFAEGQGPAGATALRGRVFAKEGDGISIEIDTSGLSAQQKAHYEDFDNTEHINAYTSGVTKLSVVEKGKRMRRESREGARGRYEAGYIEETGQGVTTQFYRAVEPEQLAVKFAKDSDELIEGPGMPYGGPFNGRDLDQQFFSAKTDFAFDWFGEGVRPLLYHHGLDEDAGTAVVGRVKAWETKDLGVWTRAQLDKQSKYFAAIRDLVKSGKLYFSSGAMAHLVQIDGKSGEIKRWPWVELSLTPTPANLLATVDYATAEKHYKAAGLDPDSLKAASEKRMRAMLREMADEMGMQMSDEEMAEMMAGMDAEMPEDEMRSAMRKKLEGRMAKKSVEPASLKALSGSYEELLEKLNAAINPHNPFASADRYAYVEATFPDYFIAKLHQDGESTCYRVAYSLSGDGEVTLGKMQPVEEAYVPKAKAAGIVPERLADHTEIVSAYAAALAQRTRDLSERRTKEGRVLSTATRKRLGTCLETMRGACDEMQSLLESTDTAKAEAKATLARLLEDTEIFALEAAL